MNIKSLLFACLSTALVSQAVFAQQLFKWVDEQGITHYGDALPEKHTEHESFVFTEYQQVSLESNPEDDYYSIQNQLKRLQDRRAADLERKQQLAEIKAANNPPAPQVQEVYLPNQQAYRDYYRPAYLPFGFANKYYPKKYKHHVAGQSHQQHKPVKQHRSGLVSKSAHKSTKASFSASK